MLLATVCAMQAQTTWDGGGAADTSWGTAANWNNDTLPAFDGTDSLTAVVTDTTAGRGAMTLGANRSISRLTIGNGGGVNVNVSLTGDTLTLTKTDSSAATGNALWNASNRDGYGTTVNSAIQLLAGSPGGYTAHLRENNNAHGGTVFNGAITQGAGEEWTLAFSQASARGAFSLANANNLVTRIKTLNTTCTFLAVGAQGPSASTTLEIGGGAISFNNAGFHTTPVDNGIVLTAAGALRADAPARLTGTLTQGSYAIDLGGTSILRFENADMTAGDTGGTLLRDSVLVSVSSMAKLSSGLLSLGKSGISPGRGVFALSGEAGHDVPTWTEFSSARTYGTGSGNWRIVRDSKRFGGGFAAKDADLTIPKDATTTDGIFADSFTFGSAATLGGTRYANNAVILEQDVSMPALASTEPRKWRFVGGKITDSPTEWILDGPVHEIAGKITGGSANNVLAFQGEGESKTTQDGLTGGMVRISNPDNDIQLGALYIGTDRHVGSGFDSADDVSGLVAIFTSDDAFGSPALVQVVTGGDSGRCAAMLLFEDESGTGTTFARDFNIEAANNLVRQSGFGGFGGKVVYSGTATLLSAGSGTNDKWLPLHVQDGELTFDGATISNNRGAATNFELSKGGPGTLRVADLTLAGSFAGTYAWGVYSGTLILNQNSSLSDLDVYDGGTLAGTSTIDLGTATLTLDGTAAEPAAVNPGDGIGTLTVTAGKVDFADHADLVIELGATADKLVVNGNLDLTALNDRLVLRKAATMASGTYEIVRYTGNLLSYGNANEELWKFTSVVNEAGVSSYSVDYGSGSDSAITLTIVGDAQGTLIVVR